MDRLTARYVDLLVELENITMASAKCMLGDVDRIIEIHIPKNINELSCSDATIAIAQMYVAIGALCDDGVTYSACDMLKLYASKRVVRNVHGKK